MSETERPEWQSWPQEPWKADYDNCGNWITAVGGDEPFGTFGEVDSIYAGERLVACVNALAGIRNPQAVAEVIEAALYSVKAHAGWCSPRGSCRNRARDDWCAVCNAEELAKALARLDQPPEEG